MANSLFAISKCRKIYVRRRDDTSYAITKAHNVGVTFFFLQNKLVNAQKKNAFELFLNKRREISLDGDLNGLFERPQNALTSCECVILCVLL